MTERASIFSNPLEMDISDFAPKENAVPRPALEDIDRTAGHRFKSREAAASIPVPQHDDKPTVDQQSTKRQPMVYRTGRNVVFSVKTTQTTVDQFYKIAQTHGWKAGETFEKAVGALEQKIESDFG